MVAGVVEETVHCIMYKGVAADNHKILQALALYQTGKR
jgi:hypothetical protein